MAGYVYWILKNWVSKREEVSTVYQAEGGIGVGRGLGLGLNFGGTKGGLGIYMGFLRI